MHVIRACDAVPVLDCKRRARQRVGRVLWGDMLAIGDSSRALLR
jgi:hypothetical protein